MSVISRLFVWFRTAYPLDGVRRQVLAGYSMMAGNEALMRDIALRGNVFAESPAADASEYEIGRFMGRRDYALETLRICEKDPMRLLNTAPTLKPEERA